MAYGKKPKVIAKRKAYDRSKVAKAWLGNFTHNLNIKRGWPVKKK